MFETAFSRHAARELGGPRKHLLRASPGVTGDTCAKRRLCATTRSTNGVVSLRAVRSGEAQVLTQEKLLERIEASQVREPVRVISLRVSAAELARTRRQAGLSDLNEVRRIRCFG